MPGTHRNGGLPSLSLLRVRAALVAVPLTIAATIRLWHGGVAAFPVDDAYISLHAARYLLSPSDPSYPGSPPLTGATSLLHVLVLRVAMLVGSPIFAAEFVTWFGAAAYLIGAATLITARVSRRGIQVGLMAVACLLGSTAYHLANGQETGWAFAAVIWTLHWLTEDGPTRSRLAWMAGLLPWVRPDLGVVSAALWLYRFMTARQRWWHDALIIGICGVAGMSVYMYAIGHPFPNTLAAKQHFFGSSAFPLLLKVAVAGYFFRPWLWQLGPDLLGLLFAARHRTDRIILVALIAQFAGLTIASPKVVDHNFYRYLHPLMIPLVVAGLCTWAGRPCVLAVSAGVRRELTVLLVSALIWPWASIWRQWHQYRESQQIVVNAQQDIADWLTAHVAPHTRVLVHDAGYLSEHTTMDLIDLVGLKTPASIRVHAQLTEPSLGTRRGEAVHWIACATQPRYYVAFDRWERVFGLTAGLGQFGWGLTPVVQHMVYAPVEDEELAFTLYRLTSSTRCPSPMAPFTARR